MIRTTRRLATLAALATVTATTAIAGPMHGEGPLLGPPTFLRHLYPPRLVMRNQKAIGLTDEQRRSITGAISDTRKQLTDLEWKREAAAEALGALVAVPRVDEEAALARAAELMVVEQDIKRAHLRLLVRVKNQLTAEQQTTLDGLRDEWRSDRRRRRHDRLRPRDPADPAGR